MRHSVLRGSAVAAATLALGVAVAGCGGDDGGPSAAATTAGPVATSTRTAPSTTAPRPTTTESAPTTTGTAPPTGTTRVAPPTEALTPENERRYFPNVLPFRKVPQESDRAANPAAVKVVESWFAFVRANRTGQAADLMADGARYSNFVGIGLLRNRAARIAILDDLTCGAVPTDAGGARDGYVVLTLRLVDRTGFPPCDGKGASVAVSLHVTKGKIDDWIRVLAADAPINRGTPA